MCVMFVSFFKLNIFTLKVKQYYFSKVKKIVHLGLQLVYYIIEIINCHYIVLQNILIML